MNTRCDQYKEFQLNLSTLLTWCLSKNMIVRGGEWNRPDILTRIYSTGIDLVNRGLKLFSPKVGILESKHKYSLAVDLWLIDITGKKILWNDSRYAEMGAKWISLGGHWFAKDPYHFETKGKIL